MRIRLLIFAATTSLAACAGTPRLWDKEGATPQTTGVDLIECRRAARQEAFYETNYSGFGGYGGFSRFGPFPYYGHRRGPFLWRGQDLRFDREVRLTAFCMHNKGYELVTPPPPPAVAPGVVPVPAPDVVPPAAGND